MRLRELVDLSDTVYEIPTGSNGVHASTLFSYQMLEKVKDWLRAGMSGELVLSLASELKELRDTLEYKKERGEL